MARRRQVAISTFVHRFPILRTLSLMAVVLLVWLLLNIGSLNKFLAAYQERNRERDSVEQLRQKVAALDKQKQSLERGTFEKQKSLRERYRLIGPGEKLILIVPDETETSGTAK